MQQKKLRADALFNEHATCCLPKHFQTGTCVFKTSLKERRDIGTLAKLGKKGEVQARVLKWTSPSAAECFSAVGSGVLGQRAIGFSFPEI